MGQVERSGTLPVTTALHPTVLMGHDSHGAGRCAHPSLALGCRPGH